MTRRLLEELESSQNGSFELFEEKGKAVLRIYNPTGKGRPVHPTDLNTRVRSLQIVLDKNISLDKLIRETHAGKIPEGTPHIIGDWPKVVQRRDATLEIEVSEDQMRAYVTLQPPEGGGKALNEEQIRNALKSYGVIKGLLDNVLRELAQKPVYKKKVLVAEGKEPVPGQNGYILPLFDTLNRPRLDSSAKKVDFKQVNLIKSAKAGEPIAEKVDPTLGEPGYTVSGRALPAEPGKIAEFLLGANVEISPDGKKLLSKIDGRPVMESNGRIRVDEVVYLKNIDYSTGNVDFPGSVIVEESVADGFKLRASGSVVLQSSVGACDIEAGKDVILSAGFMGRGGGKITSEGDVYARFVEQGTIIARGSIFISEASLHSRLIAGGAVVVKGGRGDINGGEVLAGKYVHCSKLGGAGETRTVLTVGIDPEQRKALEDIQASLKEKEATLEKIRTSLNRINDVMKKRRLDEKETETREKLVLAFRKYKSLVESEQQQLDNLRNSFHAHLHAYVLVENQLFPNVEINFGRGMLYRSPLRAQPGPIVIYPTEERTVATASSLPKYIEKYYE
ncbi:MAG: FapA family protein [Turneriella sp.]|nr:FapA family protein [Turneriella sp.]